MQRVVNLTVLKKEEPHQTQQENIRAVGTLGSLIKTCLGPRAMVKMILTQMGSMELTNDGNSVLREMEVAHPAIKSLVELARTQSEEVGDGTTSVVILASEILQETGALLKEIHPVVIGEHLKRAMDLLLAHLKKISFDSSVLKKRLGEGVAEEIVRCGVGTKLSRELLPVEGIALRAIEAIKAVEDKRVRCDIKHNLKIEKIPGGEVGESRLLDGVVVNKEILSPSMRREIREAKVLLIDFPLEYRKGENHMAIEMHSGDTFERAHVQEEEQVKKSCEYLMRCGPDVIVSEKGVCDNAVSYFCMKNVSVVRRVKKTENNRISKATGAQIISRAEDAEASKLGKCGLFKCSRIGEEFFCSFTECASPKACSILLRGPSKDILNELERNLHDALGIARNMMLSSSVVVGAGAAEMSMALSLERERFRSEKERKVFLAVSRALKTIPGILLANSGCTNPSRAMVELEARNGVSEKVGVDGETGEIAEVPVWESVLVKEQCIKAAIEGAILILRVDGVISSSK
jgi:T-complex protein 1 subunit gamma